MPVSGLDFVIKLRFGLVEFDERWHASHHVEDDATNCPNINLIIVDTDGIREEVNGREKFRCAHLVIEHWDKLKYIFKDIDAHADPASKIHFDKLQSSLE